MSGEVLLVLSVHLSSSGFTLTNPCASTAANTRGNAATTSKIDATTSKRWRVIFFRPPAPARAERAFDAATRRPSKRYARNPAIASAGIVYDLAPIRAADAKFMAMRIGFIGLGVMGTPMAGHLAKAGHSLTVLDI